MEYLEATCVWPPRGLLSLSCSLPPPPRCPSGQLHPPHQSISISGGMESKLQPMIHMEKIFPGGAASTSDVLKVRYELVSVDGESLQRVTHQYAVDVFSNKAKDPMVFVVKISKGPQEPS
ncbi:PDZ domain-containing protein 7 [Coregonus clupeaformis]|uniref:PDZ domain-containing protein 7 n=1 Tax=Coregonus clupeaformis TaxID=59861 RepID=UPI001BE0382D|nr:PDZ domain-containing protein 7 [Coregonus clupeaformis]XP_041722570.1 PDZ domain-containing protein 7 [Coregonus clupeaformis]XP_041722571.1 PDZ domain-containing protein 7 [Coregonus clupeaformis]XP_041722572.1 PDZ domain-containing protein 7 [Coregonus clupeaformis]XP_041722574.1 PDZ domain-containing protein 7 [Coregonus clupeaformis]XP_041722575.1 PDZ domain-containing protein 7 [Coregonus clupeaformis]